MIQIRFQSCLLAITPLLLLALSSQLNAADGSIQVEVTGKLFNDVLAIGGETTGVTITANGATWELDLGDKNVALQKAASELSGKFAVVRGEFEIKKGVEIGSRSIVKVKSLEAAKADKEISNVTITGKLNSEVVAIGGETTGVVISASGAAWELDFGDNAALRKLASKLHNSSVTAVGEFHVKKGIEIGARSIVSVKSLAAAVAKGDNPYLTDKGMLANPLELKDAQGGFAGFSGHIWTIEPNGAWKRQPFLNADVRKADQTGKFDTAEIKFLADHLTKQDLFGLPKQVGKNIGANPHNFTLTFGDKATTMILPPGADPPAKDPKTADTPEQRFAALIRLLKRGMKGEAQKE